MNPTSNLNYKEQMVNDGKDAIVIVKTLGEVPGGRTLDVSGLPAGTTVVRAGHVLRMHNTTKAVSPVPVSSGQYTAVGDGYSYLGVLKCTVAVDDARAAIVTIGQVNAAASPYPVTEDIKTALPRIQFLN